MKTKITSISIGLILITTSIYAQKKEDLKTIIDNKVTIKKYHDSEELGNMQKGELLKLYMERITVLTNTLPYIAFATKPNVTMSNLGIPDTKENIKALEDQHENTDIYVSNTSEFQKIILPYSDTNRLTNAILFYEDIMKSLHNYEEFN